MDKAVRDSGLVSAPRENLIGPTMTVLTAFSYIRAAEYLVPEEGGPCRPEGPTVQTFSTDLLSAQDLRADSDYSQARRGLLLAKEQVSADRPAQAS